jgi:hypothetical protein
MIQTFINIIRKNFQTENGLQMKFKFLFPLLTVRKNFAMEFIPCCQMRNFMSKSNKKRIFIQIVINSYPVGSSAMRMGVISQLA